MVRKRKIKRFSTFKYLRDNSFLFTILSLMALIIFNIIPFLNNREISAEIKKISAPILASCCILFYMVMVELIKNLFKKRKDDFNYFILYSTQIKDGDSTRIILSVSFILTFFSLFLLVISFLNAWPLESFVFTLIIVILVEIKFIKDIITGFYDIYILLMKNKVEKIIFLNPPELLLSDIIKSTDKANDIDSLKIVLKRILAIKKHWEQSYNKMETATKFLLLPINSSNFLTDELISSIEELKSKRELNNPIPFILLIENNIRIKIIKSISPNQEWEKHLPIIKTNIDNIELFINKNPRIKDDKKYSFLIDNINPQKSKFEAIAHVRP
jgi:hypothetical protein